MAPTRESLRRWHRDNPNRALAMGVALFVIGLSLWVGFKTRRATAELASKGSAWQATSNQLATARQQFRVPTSTESAALIAESAQLGALGVPGSEELTLVESVGRLAEACSLTRVRANSSVVPDSSFTPQRSIGAQRIEPADYAVTLEFAGSFAGVVQFVSNLPPSVSLSRISAARNGAVTVYHVVLSVYALNASNAG